MGMCRQDHVAGMVGGAVCCIRGDIVKKLVNGGACVDHGHGLLGPQ